MDPEAAFARYYPALYRYLQRLAGDPDLAADLAQEAFVRLLDHEIPEERARSWLFTVATNLLRDRARSRDRHRRLLAGRDLSPDPPVRADERVEREERIAAVRAALARLSERDRRMLMLREEGLLYREIAEVVGVAAGSVGTLLARALDRFADAYRRVEARGAGSRERPDEGKGAKGELGDTGAGR